MIYLGIYKHCILNQYIEKKNNNFLNLSGFYSIHFLNLSRKTNILLRLKEDKLTTKEQRQPSSPGRPSSRAGTSIIATEKEKDELKAVIRNLEEKLKGNAIITFPNIS